MQGVVLSAPLVAFQSSGMQHSPGLPSKPTHLTRVSKFAWQWISSNRETLTVTYSKPEKRICVSVLKNGRSIPVKFETLPAELKSVGNSKQLNQILAHQHVRVVSSSRDPKLYFCTKLRRERLSPEGQHTYDGYSKLLSSLKDHLEGLANPVVVKAVLDLFKRKSEEVLDISAGFVGWMKDFKASLETQRHIHELSRAVTKVADFLITADDVGDFCQELREELDNLIPYPNIDENFPDELTNFFSHPAVARLTGAEFKRLYKEISHVRNDEGLRRIVDKYFRNAEDRQLLDGTLANVIKPGLLNPLAAWKQSDTFFLGRAIFFSNKYLGIISDVQRISENTVAFYLDNKFEVIINVNESVIVNDNNENTIFTEFSINHVNNCIKIKKASFEAAFNSFINKIEQQTIEDIALYGEDFNAKKNLSILIENIKNLLTDYSRPCDNESIKKTILQIPTLFHYLKSSPQHSEEVIITSKLREVFEHSQKTGPSREILVLRDPNTKKADSVLSFLRRKISDPSLSIVDFPWFGASAGEEAAFTRAGMDLIVNPRTPIQVLVVVIPASFFDKKPMEAFCAIQECFPDIFSKDWKRFFLFVTGERKDSFNQFMSRCKVLLHRKLQQSTNAFNENDKIQISLARMQNGRQISFFSNEMDIPNLEELLKCPSGEPIRYLSAKNSREVKQQLQTIKSAWAKFSKNSENIIETVDDTNSTDSNIIIENENNIIYDDDSNIIINKDSNDYVQRNADSLCRTLLSPCDEDLYELMRSCPGLTQLTINGEDPDRQITDKGLTALAQRCPGLTHLELNKCTQIRGASIIALARYCPGLAVLDIERCTHIGGPSLIDLLKHCPKLTSISIDEVSLFSWGAKHPEGMNSLNARNCDWITDDDITTLATNYPLLTKVEFSSCARITKSSLDALTKHCPGLISLRVTWDTNWEKERKNFRITNANLITITKRCPSLTELVVNGSPQITDAGLATLATNCRGLVSLSLPCKRITDAGLTTIATNYPGLIELNLTGGCKEITVSSLIALAKYCPKLTSISLDEGWLTATKAEDVSDQSTDHTGLTSLEVRNCDWITDDDIAALACCPGLTTLYLSKCTQIRGTCLISLAKYCPKLTSISLDKGRLTAAEDVSDQSTDHTGLTSLIVRDCDWITDDDIAALAACCPGLTTLHLKSTQIRGTCLISLAKYCPKLTTLYLSECTQIRGTCLISLAKYCPKLTSLFLDRCYTLMEQDIVALAKHCPNLTSLDLARRSEDPNDITDNGLAELTRLFPKLISLTLVHCNNITSAGLTNLAQNCPGLTNLYLDDCRAMVKKGFLVDLANQCPNLTKVTLRIGHYSRRNFAITDTDLGEMGKLCPQLKSVDFYGWSGITSEGAAALIEHCSGLTQLSFQSCARITTDNVVRMRAKYPAIHFFPII